MSAMAQSGHSLRRNSLSALDNSGHQLTATKQAGWPPLIPIRPRVRTHPNFTSAFGATADMTAHAAGRVSVENVAAQRAETGKCALLSVIVRTVPMSLERH
jgi:hypothetical protein